VVRLLRSPTVFNAVLLGVACGAEALVRAELILLVPGLLVPAVLAARRLPVRRRLGLLAVGLLATAVVLAPWVGRNLATFKDPTYLSTGNGLALLGANCPLTYSGPSLGSWALGCVVGVSGRAEHHVDRLPVVVLARVGRLWDFYEPIQMAQVDANEGRPEEPALAGLGLYYALLPLGVAGIVILRRRRVRVWYLLVPAGVLTVVSAVFYGLVRFRAPFEVCLVVLAAPPLVLAAQALGRRLGWRPRPVLATEAAPGVMPDAGA
jgi:4-amino-4-deoxy-L-arabinose transferase-like glycosyltransferase